MTKSMVALRQRGHSILSPEVSRAKVGSAAAWPSERPGTLPQSTDARADRDWDSSLRTLPLSADCRGPPCGCAQKQGLQEKRPEKAQNRSIGDFNQPMVRCPDLSEGGVQGAPPA